MNFQKTFTTLATVLVLSLSGCYAAPVWSQEAPTVTIGAGKPGRSYDKWAVSTANFFKQRGYESVVQNYKGSDEITLALCEGKVDFAPAQQDAAFQRETEGCSLIELWTYPSEEYTWLLVPPESSVDELGDLKESSVLVTDDIGSGSDFTLRQLRRIEQELGNKSPWSKLQIENGSLKTAVGKGAAGKVAGVFFVSGKSSADLAFFLEKGWKPVEVYDSSLDNVVYGGSPLYQGDYQTVQFKTAKGKAKELAPWVYKVNTFIYGKELEGELQSTFESVMSTQ